MLSVQARLIYFAALGLTLSYNKCIIGNHSGG
jgi:hypothetical protein